MSAHLPVERIRVVSGGLARVLTTPLALVPHRTLGPARSSRVTTHAREPGSSFRNVALLNQSRKKATSLRHSIAAHARSDPDAMATQIAKKIVVVGGGNSAGYFARAVVAAGRGADLLICSAEEVLPYERPALTKAFLNETGPARLPGFHLRRRRRRATEPGVVRRQRRRGPPRHPRGRMGPVRQDGHHRQIHVHRLRETHRRDRMHRAQAPGVHGRRPPGRTLRPRQRRRPLPLRRHGRRQSTRGHRRR